MSLTPEEAYLLGLEVRVALREVIDPEIGGNLVDLGLIYGVAIDDDGHVRVTMTTTSRGCPAADFLRQAVAERSQSVEGVRSVEVELTYDPPWTPEMITAL